MKKVNYIEYSAGNFLSLKNSLKKLGYETHIVEDPNKILEDRPIIIPGVGNFGYCVEQFKLRGFYEYFRNNKNLKVNVIGICVGMQIMFEKSEESPEKKGLGIFDGCIENLSKLGANKIPSIGWFNTFNNNGLYGKYYYIHSFGNISKNRKDDYYYLNNGIKITSIIKKDNYIGIQFHPEKSGESGLKLLDGYLD